MTVLKRQPNHKQESDSLFVTDVTSGVDRTGKEVENLNGWKRRGGVGVGGGEAERVSVINWILSSSTAQGHHTTSLLKQ